MRVLLAGMHDEKAQTYLREASGTSRQAMKGAMDGTLWSQIKVAAMTRGVDNPKTQSLLAAVSSFEARSTMRTALEAQIWPDLQRKVAIFGLDNKKSQNLLNKIPSDLRQTVRSALDTQLWKDIQKKARTADAGTIRQQLSKASCFDATELLRSVLASGQRQEARQPRGIFTDADYANFATGSFGRARSERVGTPGTRPRDGRQYQRAATPPPQSATEARAARAANEVTGIVAKAVAKDPGLSWLKTTDTADIARVINTVQRLRARAGEQGKELTDKEVYIKYRRAVEVPPAEVNPRILNSYKILDAFMGGVKGRLPF